jgi:hypothetical protein
MENNSWVSCACDGPLRKLERKGESDISRAGYWSIIFYTRPCPIRTCMLLLVPAFIRFVRLQATDTLAMPAFTSFNFGESLVYALSSLLLYHGTHFFFSPFML